MYAIFCPHCEETVLLGPESIERVDNTADGLVVAWRCYEDHRGVLFTGRLRDTA